MASNNVSTEVAVAPQEAAGAVVGSKGKVVADEGNAAAAAAGEGTTSTFVSAVGERFVDEATGIEYVDMPESYLSWVLSQKRLSTPPYDPKKCTMMSPEEIEREVTAVERLRALQAGIKDEFFEFQAWVCETYKTKGHVLIPVDSIPEAFTQEEDERII